MFIKPFCFVFLKRGDKNMMKEGHYKMWMGICWIVIGVLVWLNAVYDWWSWAKFIAVLAILGGIKLLVKSGYSKKKKK